MMEMSEYSNSPNNKALVVCNFSKEESEYKEVDGSKLLLSNVDISTGIAMQPYEARIYLI
jgi:hypothetical protein